jgi:hypothetical protein
MTRTEAFSFEKGKTAYLNNKPVVVLGAVPPASIRAGSDQRWSVTVQLPDGGTRNVYAYGVLLHLQRAKKVR